MKLPNTAVGADQRMDDGDAGATHLANSVAEDIPTGLNGHQFDAICRGVLAGTECVEAGEHTEYNGRTGPTKFAEEVKARGGKLVTHGKLWRSHAPSGTWRRGRDLNPGYSF